jgi:hypothetical protein
MNRTAVLYGLWAALCMAIAMLAFFAIADLGAADAFKGSMFDGPAPTLRAISFLLPFCIPTGIVAGLGWAAFHRGGREPGWPGYCVLALLVVVASHVLIFSTASIATGETNMGEVLRGLGFMLLLHGWLSIPMALIGTAAFVIWSRHAAI